MKESVLVSDHNQLYTMVHTVSTNILSIPVMHLLLWTSWKHNAAMTSMLKTISTAVLEFVCPA